MAGFVRRHPVASFYVLALAIGAGIVHLAVAGTLPPRLALASVLSASISGVVITAVEDGRSGLKLMWGRLLRWRAGPGYWIFAFVFIVPLFLAGSTFNPLFGGDSLDLSRMEPAFPILPMFITFFIVSGLGQELGWTGFLIIRLQRRHSALVSSIIRAVLVTIWHLPLLLYSRHPQPALADFPYSGWIAQRGFLVALAVLMLAFALPWSIFQTWMFNNTKGSLLLVSVLHASEIWVAYLMMRTGIDPDNIDNYWGYGAAMMLAATAMVLATGYQHLSRVRQKIVHQHFPSG